jgi:hypothetical protein
VPVSAVTQIGNQTYCYLALDGKAARTPVQTGVRDGTWVEVAGKLVRSEGTWEAFDGSEAVIDGDLSLLGEAPPRRLPTPTARPRSRTSLRPRTVVQPTPARPRWRAGPEPTVPRAAATGPARAVV